MGASWSGRAHVVMSSLSAVALKESRQIDLSARHGGVARPNVAIASVELDRRSWT